MSWTAELLLQFLIHLMMEAGLISANKNILPVGLRKKRIRQRSETLSAQRDLRGKRNFTHLTCLSSHVCIHADCTQCNTVMLSSVCE